MTWRQILGEASSTPPEEKSVKTAKKARVGGFANFTDTSLGGSALKIPPIQRSARDQRLMDFCRLVDAHTLKEGVHVDFAAIMSVLSESEREIVAAGLHTSAEHQILAETLALRSVMARGLVPNGWTDIAVCVHCGPVWAPPNTPARVAECSWCDLTRAGHWFPRPKMLCCECRHFRPDAINPPGGLGSCGAGHDDRLTWPHSQFECAEWWGIADG